MVAESASTANDTTPSRFQPTWLALLGFGLATRLIVVVLRCFLALPESSVSTVDVLSTLHMVAYSRDLLVTILFLGLGIHAFLERRPLWGCMVLVPVLQALASGSILSMTRVVLSSYPGFGDAAEIASNRAVFGITVVVCLFAQFVLLTSYVNWVFVA